MLPAAYRLRPGHQAEQSWVSRFTLQSYQELDPQRDYNHLCPTLRQYLSDQTPFWLAEYGQGATFVPIGCIWLGRAVDQRSGDRYTHVFLLYVEPAHRRQGLGSALMQQAEEWARQQGDRQLGVQVFADNPPGLALYQHLGFHTQFLALTKSLPEA